MSVSGYIQSAWAHQWQHLFDWEGNKGYRPTQAVVCIFAIFAGGRLFIQPLYKKMSQV